MNIRRLSFFATAVAVGAASFFWSVQVQGRGSGGPGGSYCTSENGANATMCYEGTTTIYNVPPATQSTYLANGQATCNACPTTGM